MYQNNNMYGGMMYGAGMQYGQQAQAKMTQVLTPEQIKALRTTSSAFSLQVDPLEVTRSICTHKDQGKISLVENPNGTVTCTVCGATFKLLDIDQNQVVEITNMFIDILQSIKTYYLDIPENYVNEYFRMIPLLEKVPKFYELALHNFRKYEQSNPLQQGNNMFGFNMLGALTSPGFGYGMQMNPAMGGYSQQPQQFVNPQQGFVQQPGYGMQMQQPVGYNPFGQMTPPAMYQQVPQQQPMGQQQQPVDQTQNANAGQNQVHVTKVMNV